MMHEKKNLVKNLETENFPVSIGRASIKYQSSQTDSNQKICLNFDRSRNIFNRLKIQKTQFIEKQRNFLQKLLKVLNFMNKMHEYEMKCFLKNTCIEPRFPKNKMFNQLSLNSQTANMFCIKLKEYSNLVGQTKITQNIMYKVQQRITWVVCETSKSLRYM